MATWRKTASLYWRLNLVPRAFRIFGQQGLTKKPERVWVRDCWRLYFNFTGKAIQQHCTTITETLLAASFSGLRIKILFELPLSLYGCTCEIGSNKDFRPTGNRVINGLINADRQLLFTPFIKSFPTEVIQDISGSMFVALNKLLFLQLYFAISGVCQTGVYLSIPTPHYNNQNMAI